jgi:hypothetical protein
VTTDTLYGILALEKNAERITDGLVRKGSKHAQSMPSSGFV